MKWPLSLFVVTIFVVACSRNTEKDSNHPQMVESNNPLTESTVKGIPPKPVTKGLYDFSECRAKFKVGTEDYKKCVKAKYPNIKFAGEE